MRPDATSTVPAASRSRRRFLIAGGGVAVLLGGGVAASVELRNHSLAKWVEALVQTSLPGYRLESESAVRLMQTIDRHDLMRTGRARWAAQLKSKAPWALSHLRSAVAALDQAERLVLTELLLGSNFFRAPPADRVLVYQPASPVCGNPFAHFHDAPGTGLL